MSLQSPSRTDAPDRLAAVRRTALLDTPPEASFDRLTRMAARLLGAPVALISLVTDDREFFKSASGLSEPWAARRGLPLAYSLCRHVVEADAPVVVEDVRRHPLMRSNQAARELGWVAYAGVPLVTGLGFTVGALSVIDAAPRLWSERDIALLQDLGECAVAEIELRSLRAQSPAETVPRSGLEPPAGFEATGIPTGIISGEGRWLRVNRPLTELLGYAEEELLGSPADRITHPADREADREALALLLAGEVDSYSGEKRCLTRSADLVWVLATVAAVPAGPGRPRQLVIGFQDITDRKAAEVALRDREERYRLAAGAASDVVWEWNLATDRVTWSEGLEPAFGWPPPPAASAGWWYERIHADDRERVMEAIRTALAKGNRAWELEYRFRRADGSWARVADRGLVVVSVHGEPARLVGTMTDVGARHEAGDPAVGRGEARYRSVLDHLREVVFQTDLAGRWLLLNPAWEELTGFGVAESIGTPFLDYVHPDDRARNAREVEPLIARRKTSSRYEVRYLTRDGAFRWVEVQARLTLDERGEPAGTTGTLTDQTERKRAELLSIGQSRLLEEIASGAALGRVLDGIVRFAEEHATPSIATLMLLRPETGELTLASGSRLPEAARQALAVVPVGPEHGSCGTAVHRRERVVSRDIASDPLWAPWPQRDLVLAAGLRSSWSVPIVAVTGEVLGTFAIYYVDSREPAVEDLRIVEIATHLAAIAIERERAQAAVRRTSMLLEQVLESLPVGVWVLAEDGRIVFGNRAGQEIWGGVRYLPLEALGEYRGWWVETGQPIAAGDWAVARAIRHGETSLNELVRIETFDGRERIILNSAVPVRGPGGEVVGAISVNQDITERHAAETALRQSEHQLRQAQKMEAVGQLAGGIAHDFNNLLTGILSYCELILQEVRGDDPIRGDVEQIRHAGLRAAGLTRQLLAFSRRQVLQPRVLSLNSTVAELDGMLRRLLAADVMLESDLDPRLGYVMADPGQIEQVLVNLVVNARDAMPRGGRVRIATTNVRLPAEGDPRPDGVRPGAYVALSVVDTGIGMDLETQARIFEPFFTTKEPGKGTGLGLSTVYGIVQQSGGQVTVESAPGQGATFTVYLPRHDGTAAALPARPDRRSLPGGRELLLLVEDEAAVRSSARRLLECHGYTVLEARHGADALRMVEEGGPEVDLVLTDVVMPEMGGRELVERLRSRRPTLKVLYMSGYTDKAITPDGMMPPGTGFVEKPFTVEQLLRRVRETLDEREQREDGNSVKGER